MFFTKFKTSFRIRVAGAALLTACIALVAALSLFFVLQWTQERRQFVEERTVSAQVAAANLAAAVLFEDRAGASDTLASVRQVPDFSRAMVFDASGRLFAEAGESSREALAPSGSAAPTFRYTANDLQIHVPIKLDGARVGELVLVLGLDHFDTLTRQYALFTLLFLGLAALGAGLVAYALAGHVIRPVNHLSRAMGRVRRDGDLSARVHTTSTDELGRLTDDFNALLASLQHNDGELKRAVSELVEARDAAEAASLTKSQFLANMSHEIRTPLNGVLGMAQVMARDPLSDTQRERLDVIRSSGQGLLSLLNDLLDLSKVEAGKLELEAAEFDLARTAHLACDPFFAVADTKDLALILDIAPPAQGVWLGDPVRVRQIIANLVSNAIKFTRQGVVRVTLSRTDADGTLVVTVADSGVGVPAEKIPLLFEKFSQADASTTREFGGTGLGLAICRELTELMAGTIACESRPGVGTTFTVLLPLERLRDADAAQPAEAASPTTVRDTEGVIRILAAEDNPTNQLVLKALLEPAGVDLFMVGNGAEAVSAWQAAAFDLILMDVQMPVMDGVTAMRRIRDMESDAGRGRTPIIVLTANAMKHQVAEYFDAGADSHVAKPIEAEILYAALDRALSGNAAIAA